MLTVKINTLFSIPSSLASLLPFLVLHLSVLSLYFILAVSQRPLITTYALKLCCFMKFKHGAACLQLLHSGGRGKRVRSSSSSLTIQWVWDQLKLFEILSQTKQNKIPCDRVWENFLLRACLGTGCVAHTFNPGTWDQGNLWVLGRLDLHKQVPEQPVHRDPITNRQTNRQKTKGLCWGEGIYQLIIFSR